MPENEVKVLTYKRGQLKGQITRFNNFLKSIDKNPSNSTEIKPRLEKIKPLFNEFENINAKLFSLDPSLETELDEEFQLFEELYFSTIASATALISLTEEQHVNAPNIRNQNSSHSTSHINLPSINIPTFDGSYENWLPFYETFKSIIHDNQQLSDIQKFHYLKSSLSSNLSTSHIINSLQTSADSYKAAWELLKQRFENKRLIVFSHVSALFDFPIITKQSPTSLQNLIDQVNLHLKSLNSLDVDTSSWDILIIQLITSKLDFQTRKEWELKATKDLPNMEELTEFINQRCQVLTSLDKNKFSSNQQCQQPQKQLNSREIHKRGLQRVLAHSATASRPTCQLCKETHHIYQCNQFLNLSIEDRIKTIKKLKLCSNCFKFGHMQTDCFASSCRNCNRKHNTLLHLNQPSSQDQTNNKYPNTSGQANNVTITNVTYKNKSSTDVLLSTAVVFIYDKYGTKHKCRSLLDVGSQSNFITDSFCKKLGLITKSRNIPISGINQTTSHANQIVDVKLQSRYNSYTTNLSCLVLPKITDNIPQTFISPSNIRIPPNIKLADTDFNVSAPIDLLIGAEIFWELLCIGQIKVAGSPYVQKTHLGWIIGGSYKTNKSSKTTHCNLVTNEDLNKKLTKFWEVQEIHSKKVFSVDEEMCENHFKINYSREENGRFTVKLPFKKDISQLGNSKETSLKRFSSLETRLDKNSKLREAYNDFMYEYLNLGHMEKVEDANSVTNSYYLPHHPIFKESSITTKLRVVFDGSAKTTSGTSLNDHLLVGPTIQPQLFEILLQFRTHKIAFTADITKMYRQIKLHSDHRNFHRIFWRENSQKEIAEYRLTTVTYGTASAPYLAVRCLQQLAQDNKNDFPDIYKIIVNNFYVDDCLTGAETVKEAKLIRENLIKILGQGGFKLSKWASNSEEVISRNMQQEVININENGNTKTLGLLWNTTNDYFKFQFNKITSNKVSKRTVLSVIAQIYDPLGLISPVIIQAKIFMQKLWCLQLNWDESLPIKYYTEWSNMIRDFNYINQIQIPRHVIQSIKNTSFELHGFCDSSEVAFGACMYIKSKNNKGEVTINLLCAKSRVAPLKNLSLPKLELCGALLLARLANKVISTINIKFTSCFYWTDSTIVLSWLSSPSRNWKTFVANRTAEIQTLTQTGRWLHVPTKENPADIISRGVTAHLIMDTPLWWYGPQWLKGDSNEWPRNSVFNNDNSDIPEMRQVFHNLILNHDLINYFQNFSNFNKLQRSFAYVYRFIVNCKNKSKGEHGALTSQEIEHSRIQIIKIIQLHEFNKEIKSLQAHTNINKKSKLYSLNPFLDEDTILRVGGRLRNAPIPFKTKYPIILPRNNHVTNLIIKQEHLRQLHAGTQATLNALRQSYWIIAGRSTVRNIIHKCYKCFRAKPITIQQLMGDLPQPRVESSRPFMHTGVDYAGPLLIKEKYGRRSRSVKAYIALFVCFSTKACHIELVSDLTTEAFLNALKRFIARRGMISHIYSDNATNFVGANNELKQLHDIFQSQHFKNTVIDNMSSNNITWHFIPPRSPNFGGLWEAGIKSVKNHIKRVVGNALLSFEEMYTFLTLVESCLNSRPIIPMSDDPTDLHSLTPGHFLIGCPLTTIVEPSIINLPINRLSQWQRVQQLHQHFWRRWKQEYLTQLQQRNKWNAIDNRLQLGCLVVIKDDHLPPLKWALGRVAELHPGKDNVARVASVQTTKGIVKIAVNKLCLLPSSEELQ